MALSVSPTEEPHFHHLYSFFWSSPTARNHRWGQECRMNTFIHNLHSSTIWSSFSILLKCLSEFFVYGTWFCSCRTFHVWTGKLLIGAQILFPSNLILFQEFFSRGSLCYSVMCSRLSMFSNVKQCDYWK